MFTGIISKTSKVEKILLYKNSMFLEVKNNLKRLKVGESVSLNGVCSTVKRAGRNLFFEYMPETLKLSNLAFLQKGDKVNLEESLRFGDSLSGHIVLGHIDCTAEIVSIKKEGNSKVFGIKVLNKKFMRFLFFKGSITLEGISLTVAKVLRNSFFVKIIPYTIEHTNLNKKKKGDLVNLEFDILTKYLYASKK